MFALEFPDARTADAAYAVMASRLVYWLWRVECDAFHVSRRFLLHLPFDLRAVDRALLRTLADAGRALWGEAAEHPIFAVNKGRRTVAVPPAPSGTVGNADEALVNAFGLSEAASAFPIEAWYHDIVVVDGTEPRRIGMAPIEAATC